MSPIKMYTTGYCPYCVRAKQLLEDLAGQSLSMIGHGLVDAIDPDQHMAAAQVACQHARRRRHRRSLAARRAR